MTTGKVTGAAIAIEITPDAPLVGGNEVRATATEEHDAQIPELRKENKRLASDPDLEATKNLACGYRSEPGKPIRRLRAITSARLSRFSKTRRLSTPLGGPHLPPRAAYPSLTGTRPPGTGPNDTKLACARPLSRRKTSPNGHKLLSADSSCHALQLCSYKQPLKRPGTQQ